MTLRTAAFVLLPAACHGAAEEESAGQLAGTYSFAKAVLVDPVVYRDQKNTMRLWSEDAAHGKNRQRISPPDFRHRRDRSRSCSIRDRGNPDLLRPVPNNY